MKRKSAAILITFFFSLYIGVSYSQEFEMPGYIYDITSGDIDADGSNDILVSCPFSDTITVLFNDGTGNFEEYYYNRPCGFILCGKIDSDDLFDIITRDGYYLYCLKNLGNRLFSENTILLPIQGTYSVTKIIDFNNDSLNDIIYSHTTGEYWGIFKNLDDLTFTNVILQSGSSTTDPGVGFITDDTLPDILLSYSAFDRTSINVNNSNFDFEEIVLEDNFNYITPVMNLDNQGTDDFALVNFATNKVALYTYLGNDQFELQANYYASGTYGIASFLADDFNQDGYDDFIISRCNWYDCTDSIYVYFNDLNWSFHESQKYYIGYLGFFNLKSADLNGDSFPDLYMSGAGTNGNKTLKIMWNDGSGSFSNENPVLTNDIDSFKYQLDIFPNPFITILTIELNANLPKEYSIFIRNIYGQILKSFYVNGTESKNKKKILWDGYDDNQRACSPGIYLITIESDSDQISKKIIKY